MGTEEGRQVQQNPFGAAQAAGGLISVEQQRAVAEVQAAILVARSMPRNRKLALDMILQDCADPALAEEAEYEFVRGGAKVTGPSIRLLETIARRWGNFESGVRELSRREGFSELETYAWDMETNVKDKKVFQIRHWRDTREGGHALTGERDIYESNANMAARRKRACMQAVIPTEVVNQALEQCAKTLSIKVDVTPDRINDMLAKFSELGVTREMIEARAQRHIDKLTPALMVQLGRIHNSIRDGMSSAADWFEGLAVQQAEAAEPKTGAAKLKAAATKTKRAEPTADQVLADVLRSCEKATKAIDAEIAHIALDDAADLSRVLTGDEQQKAAAAIAEASKAVSEKFPVGK